MRRPLCRECLYFDELDVYHCHYKAGQFAHTKPESVACAYFRSLQDFTVDSRLKTLWRQKQIREASNVDNFLPTLIMGLDTKPLEDI